MFHRLSLCAFRCALLGILLMVGMTIPVTAEGVGIQIDRRERFADGHAFDRPGRYENIAGSATT